MCASAVVLFAAIFVTVLGTLPVGSIVRRSCAQGHGQQALPRTSECRATARGALRGRGRRVGGVGGHCE